MERGKASLRILQSKGQATKNAGPGRWDTTPLYTWGSCVSGRRFPAPARPEQRCGVQGEVRHNGNATGQGTALVGEYGQTVRVTSVICSTVKSRMVQIDTSVYVSAEHPVMSIGEPGFIAAAQLLRKTRYRCTYCTELIQDGSSALTSHCNLMCRCSIAPSPDDAVWVDSDSAWNFTTEGNQAVRAAGSKYLIAPIGHPGWLYVNIPPSPLNINPSQESWHEAQVLESSVQGQQQAEQQLRSTTARPVLGCSHIDEHLTQHRAFNFSTRSDIYDPGLAKGTINPVVSATTRLIAEEIEFARGLCAVKSRLLQDPQITQQLPWLSTDSQGPGVLVQGRR